MNGVLLDVEVAAVVALVLVVVWVAALLPIALRKRHEWQLTASVSRFGRSSRRLASTYPAAPPTATVSPAEEPELRRAYAAHRRAEVARVRRLRARRRQTLVRFGVAVAGAFVFGLLPHLHALFDLALLGLFALAGYAALCVRAAREEEYRLAAPVARVRPVVPAPGGVVVPLRPVRPSFVIVEATS